MLQLFEMKVKCTDVILLVGLCIGIVGCGTDPSESQSSISDKLNLGMPKVGDASLPTSEEDLAQLIRLGKKQKAKYAVEDFFKNPEKTYFQISPDGSHFSYLGPYENMMNIYVQEIGRDEAVRITNETARDIAAYTWINDDRILFVKDEYGNEDYKLFGVDKSGENFIDLTPFAKITVKGSEARGFLDYVVAGTVPKPGRTSLAHALTPKGKVYAEFTITGSGSAQSKLKPAQPV